MKSSRPVRAWINQPSTLQPLHHRHGQRVLMVEHDDGSATLYPASGPTISLLASVKDVSLGWNNKYVTDVKKFSGYKKTTKVEGKNKVENLPDLFVVSLSDGTTVTAFANELVERLEENGLDKNKAIEIITNVTNRS